MDFQEFPKIPRLNRLCTITEKIDGTNGVLFIPDVEQAGLYARKVMAGSRTRWIEPGSDNYGFAAWVERNFEDLLRLGPGCHYGEWWGGGIQRGYSLNEKRFSLFNTARWGDPAMRPTCCGVVPVLYEGMFSTDMVEQALENLKAVGSIAAPGFMQPEGVVVYHQAANRLFKVTCEHDDEPKNATPPRERKPQQPRVKDPSKGGRRKEQLPFAGADRRARVDTPQL